MADKTVLATKVASVRDARFPTALRMQHRLLPLVVLTALACAPSGGEAPRPNLLLISIDTLRDDHCSSSGYARRTTPALEALAAEGVRATLAYSPTATTGPSHASLFTSLYPITHGVVKNGLPLDQRFDTLAETLAGEGYATAGVVSSFVLDPKFGYDQGFGRYDADFDPAHATIERTAFQGVAVDDAFDQRGDRTTDKASRVLRRLAGEGRPFFLFVHYFDPHAPYVSPPPFDGRFAAEGSTGVPAEAIAAYDGEIAFTDREVDRLLRALADAGLDANTLVVVISDHGEGLMDHGHMYHGVQIYEEAVRVPLIVRLPGRVTAGRTIDGPIELLDLMPTVLDLAGIARPEGLQGRSLAAALERGESVDPNRPVHLHRRHYEPREIRGIAVAGEKFGVRSGRWKYIEGEAEGTRELFDLDDDPGERINLAETIPDVAARLSERIAVWKRAFGRDRDERPELSPEDIERLKALGYVE